jgi:hypothetical protein
MIPRRLPKSIEPSVRQLLEADQASGSDRPGSADFQPAAGWNRALPGRIASR